MVVIADLASARCWVGRRRCNNTPTKQPAKMTQATSSARLTKIIATPFDLDGARPGARREPLRKLSIRVNSPTARRTGRSGLSLGAERFMELPRVGQGFLRPKPG